LLLPAFRRFDMDGGLTLWVAEDHSLPEVSLRLLVEAGAAIEPAPHCGTAELAGRLLTEGSGARTAPEMAEWLDRLGASFGASVGYDVSVLSLHALTDVLDGTLDYLAEVTLAPRFDAAEFERVRGERLDEIERESDDAASVANRALFAEIFGEHPYGRPADGLRETVAALDVEIVHGFYGRHYGGEGAAMVVCGDVQADRLAAEIRRRFGSWRGGARQGGIPEPPDAPDARPDVVVVHRPGSAQAEIRVGGLGIQPTAPDYFEVVVMNAILGGLFNSRVNMNLREDKGWTYGARTSFLLHRGVGPFVGSAAVETGVTAAAFAELLGEMRRMRTEPPSDEEIRLAKNALTLSLPRQFETPGQITGKFIHQLTLDLPLNYWKRYSDRIEQVNRDGIEAAAERRLRPESQVLLVAADADRVLPSLERFGSVEVRDES